MGWVGTRPTLGGESGLGSRRREEGSANTARGAVVHVCRWRAQAIGASRRTSLSVRTPASPSVRVILSPNVSNRARGNRGPSRSTFLQLHERGSISRERANLPFDTDAKAQDGGPAGVDLSQASFRLAGDGTNADPNVEHVCAPAGRLLARCLPLARRVPPRSFVPSFPRLSRPWKGGNGIRHSTPSPRRPREDLDVARE